MHREILGSIWKIGRFPIKVSEVLYTFDEFALFDFWLASRHIRFLEFYTEGL